VEEKLPEIVVRKISLDIFQVFCYIAQLMRESNDYSICLNNLVVLVVG
jgi:hypothetical protein